MPRLSDPRITKGYAVSFLLRLYFEEPEFIAELHMHACLSRKETRGLFNRIDYPQKDPARDGKLTYQRLEDGQAVLEIREAPKLKPEFAGEGK